MNIYHLDRKGDIDWDETVGFVITATSEAEARAIANEDCRGNEDSCWSNPSFASCRLIGRACPEMAAGIVLVDFNAG